MRREASIHASNVAHVDPKDNKPVRVGFKTVKDQKVRVAPVAPAKRLIKEQRTMVAAKKDRYVPRLRTAISGNREARD